MNEFKEIKTIGIAFNLKKNGIDDQEEEYDEIETIETLKKEIEKYGFKVILLEQDKVFFKKIIQEKPDFVFNIAEGRGKTRSRESQIPSILESLNLPYSGSDPLALAITLDKYLTNCILKSAQIPVPLMYIVREKKDIQSLTDIFKKNKCYVIKPRWEGSSKGIFLNSIVTNLNELRERVVNILVNYEQPALIEEFLEKDEITVGVCGNDKSMRILGMMKIGPTDSTQKKFLYCFENKKDWQSKIKYQPQRTISKETQNLLKKYTLLAYETLELKDIARIDFRLDKKNTPKIIDINPLPGLSPFYSDLPILYRLKGGDYSDLVRIILVESFKRYGFEYKKRFS